MNVPVAQWGLSAVATFGLLVGGPASAQDRYVAPEVELDMLVFEDAGHYEEVFSELIRQQEQRDLVQADEGDRQVSVFQDFAEDLGFESLEMYIERRETAIDLGVEEAQTTLRAEGPDSHHINDPYFRSMVNPQSEIRIGETIFRFQPDGYYRIETGHAGALEEIRRGGQIIEGEGVEFIRTRGVLADCCHENLSKVVYGEYANGSRRVKGYQEVFNHIVSRDDNSFNYGTRAGTVNLRKRNGQWIRTRADKIGVRGTVTGGRGCDATETESFDIEKRYRRSVEWEDSEENAPIDLLHPQVVTDYFSTTHWAKDLGDGKAVVVQMCTCQRAVSEFDLPATSLSSSEIPLNGAASRNEHGFLIEIHRADGTGWWSKSFSGEVGLENLSSYYNFRDSAETGTEYVVKLAVWNSCTPWHETTRRITVFGAPAVTYRVHAARLGWLPWEWDGSTAGTTTENRRIEATEIQIANLGSNVRVCYEAHVKNKGWLGAVCDGEVAGTTGKSRRMEAFRAWLEGAPAGCGVEYQGYSDGLEWTEWKRNGEVSGTVGESRRMEALRVRLIGC